MPKLIAWRISEASARLGVTPLASEKIGFRCRVKVSLLFRQKQTRNVQPSAISMSFNALTSGSSR
eukprot:4821975-Pyramimonas_sp.AAC.1